MAVPGGEVARHVTFITLPGRGDELTRRLLEGADVLRAVESCRLYIVSRTPGYPDVVRVTERWTSRAAVSEALDLPGVRQGIAEVMPLLAGPPELTESTPVGGVGLEASGGSPAPGGYTKRNLLTEVEDMAARHGFGETGEARFARHALDAGRTGISHHRLRPGRRQAFGHRHGEAEEIYVVLSGAGRAKLDDEVVGLAPYDAVRVGPGVARQFEAGPEGMELLAVGPHVQGDAEMLPGWWTD